MKKLLIAFAAIASAMVVNAAACSWSTTGTIYKPTDTTTAVAGFTAYLFDTTTVSQSALVAALRDGGSITDYTAMSTYTTPTAAKVASTAFEHAEGSISAYFAIVQDDYVFISNEKSGSCRSHRTQRTCLTPAQPFPVQGGMEQLPSRSRLLVC